MKKLLGLIIICSGVATVVVGCGSGSGSASAPVNPWKQISGGLNQPQYSLSVWEHPSESFVLMSDESSALWEYNGSSWQKLTGGVNQPESIAIVYGLPTQTSIVAANNTQLYGHIMAQIGRSKQVEQINQQILTH